MTNRLAVSLTTIILMMAACTVEEKSSADMDGNQDMHYPEMPEAGSDSDIDMSLFEIINLDYQGLELAKEHHDAGEYWYAAYEILQYYRNRADVSYPSLDANIMNPSVTASEQNIANQALASNGYRFYVRNFSESTAADGTETYYSFADGNGGIDWEVVPDGITGSMQEWVSQKHRHQWMLSQAKAYRATGNEDYIESWKEVYGDWLNKYPCPDGTVSDSDHVEWYGLQPAERIIDQYPIMQFFIQSENFTPEWLSVFLSAYAETVGCIRRNVWADHTHNIYLTQQKALFMAGTFFPEFKDASTWLDESTSALGELVKSQFNDDGVDVELDPSYHLGVVSDHYEIYCIAGANDKLSLFPSDYVQNLEGACHFMMDIIYPDYSIDNYNDTRSARLTASVLKRNLGYYMDMFPEDDNIRWMATQGVSGTKPDYTVALYRTSGYYMMRTGWDSKDMMLVLKNNYNPDNQWHCQPDNNTFTLWRNGRRFSPDAGCYDYDSGSSARNTYRMANLHNTLTKKSGVIDYTLGEFLKYDKTSNYEVVVTQNPAYSDLTHRRACLMVDGQFYVIVDEAYGSYAGTVQLHFKGGNDGSGRAMYVLDNVPETANSSEQVASGMPVGMHTVYTDNNNMMFMTFPDTGDGCRAWWNTQYFSDELAERTQRNVYRIEVDKAADKAARFVTVIYPYDAASEFAGMDVSASFTDNPEGQEGTFHESGASVSVKVNGKTYDLSYTLN